MIPVNPILDSPTIQATIHGSIPVERYLQHETRDSDHHSTPMKSLLFLALALMIGACSEPAIEGTTYGQPVSMTETTAISEILDNPSSYLGESVLVEGTIVEVCTSMGCWMDIASDREFEKIQIKVDDGVIVFPVSARGKTALVEGTVEELNQTAEQAQAHAKEMAEERGVAFDSTAVFEAGTIYRIRGLGAVIAD